MHCYKCFSKIEDPFICRKENRTYVIKKATSMALEQLDF